jgi:aspartyl protease family protein
MAEVVLDRTYDGHFYADALVNGQPVRFLVDTGASGVALTSEDARRIGLPFQPSEFVVIGSGASGDVLGKPVMLNAVTIGPKELRDVRGVIVADGLRVSLLGQSFLSRLSSVQMMGDRMTLH